MGDDWKEFQQWVCRDQAHFDGLLVDFRALWDRLGPDERKTLREWLVCVNSLAGVLESMPVGCVLGSGQLSLRLQLKCQEDVGPDIGVPDGCDHVLWPRVLLHAVDNWAAGRWFAPADYITDLLGENE
jgi:hypothetical protein